MTDVKKLVKKIRGQTQKIQTFSVMRLIIAEEQAEQERRKMWETDKKVVREKNFEKAQFALELRNKAIAAEKERQAEIAEQRLQNLKKARRALRRKQNVS